MTDADSLDERDAAGTGGNTGDNAENAVIGETGSDVISGDINDPSDSLGRDIDADPDVSPIQGGDISETPAAHSGTRCGGTGADLGTGGEVGVTRTLQSGTTAE